VFWAGAGAWTGPDGGAAGVVVVTVVVTVVVVVHMPAPAPVEPGAAGGVVAHG
jgi:hypothetical protein